jgi:methylmalonyl-CoA mutase N-terminal domain/subunit
VEDGTQIVVGVNRFVDDSPSAPAVFAINPAIEREQIDRVRAVRASRSEQDWTRALGDVDRAARGGDNLVAPVIAAVEAHATLGEVADTLRAVFGEHRDTSNG